MFKKLYRYLAKNLFYNFIAIFAIIFGVIFAIDLMEFSKRFHDFVSSPLVALSYSALHTISHITSSTGFIALICAIATFFRLNSRNELILIRFSGFSAFRILAVTFFTLAGIGLIYLLIITPISSYSVRKYEKFKMRALNEERSFIISDSGLWFKDITDDNGLKIVNVSKVQADKNMVFNVEVFSYTVDQKFLINIMAKTGYIMDGYWQLNDVYIVDSNLESRQLDEYNIPLNISIKELNNSLKDPKTIPFWQLEKVIKLAKESGFSTTIYELYYYNLLIIPIIFGAMAMFGSVLILSPQRNTGLWKRCFIAALFGMIIYFLNNIFKTFALLSALPVWLIVLIPYLVLMLISIYIAALVEESIV